MDSINFIEKAIDIIKTELNNYKANVQCIWFNYTLGNMKGIFTVIGDNSQSIFELTYNKSKSEIYIDKYNKEYNKWINY